VHGEPRLIIPAVFFEQGTCAVKCADPDNWHCMLDTPAKRAACAMVYARAATSEGRGGATRPPCLLLAAPLRLLSLTIPTHFPLHLHAI
jgi:hypothetical protein